MKWTRLYGLEATFPIGGAAAEFEDAVDLIGRNVPLFDRANEMLVFGEEGHFLYARECMAARDLLAEPIELLLLLEGTRRESLYDDYAIASQAGNAFLDLALTAVFSLKATKPGAEPVPAYHQLREHLVASVDGSSETAASAFAIDRQLSELAVRIASAYGCTVEWLFH
ncbi:hypothetical protein ACFPPD_00310 [Cohnella suwonensis]|uniref:Uncharacterized protein n=1 Tax=Cohnella suwonensis TaxID=696072 RepID=A0ABW0LMN6_9BACL